LNYTGSYRVGEFQHNNTTWAVDAVNPESPSGQSFNYISWESTNLARVVRPIEQAWRDWSGFTDEDDFIRHNGSTVAIATRYSASRMERELDTIWTQLETVIQAGSWQAIYANSDAEFDAIVAKMREDAYAFGFQQCIDWILIEVDRRRQAEADAMG
jgi:multiple sugar transport system substrate-binding protein/putative aldouronate transport system substrate-binding protein